MEWIRLNDLREKYLAFFESKQHLRLPSFPLVPQGDHSLLLINSGMAPMKQWFSGQQLPPSPRITTCQKCIRTPDIENVGKTARHGTFFEMLGNFSFGDYFKTEAAAWAWEFITQVLQMPLDRLWVSIYQEDDETKDIWVNHVGVDPSRIVRLGKQDNFWEIGTGPCGPCSEIYFDRGEQYGCHASDCAVGCDCDRYVEFWNLVFTQFNHDIEGNYLPLAHPNIDTGMGLERLACIMQGVDNLFEVDTVRNIMQQVSCIAEVAYHKDPVTDVSLRVITDHIRSAIFLLADGVTPANEGRGYVLKRLLRRAAHHGRRLRMMRPFLHELVDTVVTENAVAYPELKQKRSFLEQMIKAEEQSFHKTIAKGMLLLDTILDKLEVSQHKLVSGEDAFRLYDTYGFPIDLTREIAAEKKIDIDQQAFWDLMEQQKQRARKARMAQKDVAWASEALRVATPTEFVGYTTLRADAAVVAILSDGVKTEQAAEGQTVTVVFDRTPFYAESGGQVSDRGRVRVYPVHRTTNPAQGRPNGEAPSKIDVLEVRKTSTGLFLHVCQIVQGSLRVGDRVQMEVLTMLREAVKRNHTAAHLLQAALRKTLGDHVHQAGQLVSADSVRFDFSHFEALTKQQLEKIEHIVNYKIIEALDVRVYEMSQGKAQEMGAIALFGEKYGDVVRVADVGGFSLELCGGTHVENTSKIGLFKIVSECSVAAGVRRIEARTGTGVLRLLQETQALLDSAAQALKLSNSAELPAKCNSLVEELREARQKLDQMSEKMAADATASLIDDAVQVADCLVVATVVKDADVAALRTMGDTLKERHQNIIAVLVGVSQKATMLCICGKEAQKKGAHAGNIIRQVVALTNGKGGGRADSAMAGIGDIQKLDEAMCAVPKLIAQLLDA